VAAVSADVLTLGTDSQAWASRLRFLEPQILQSARDAGLPPARRVRLRVDPTWRPAPTPRPDAAPPARTPAAGAALAALAAGEPSPALAAALRRLARRHGGESP
jgi:hypothetical protein